ncbi:unnamed protein product [Candidula unifasciata]|uniref:Tetraspanin n=1 Tax=Candidula unifasciata TaxID=100452 RepID=A0A8S3ZVD9_9EUPU|nr:unnamed protein product [Candidula unifasciata]
MLGCALLSVGVWLIMDDSGRHVAQRMTVMEPNEEYQIIYSDTGEKDLTSILSVVLVVFGILIIIVTSIGCCGVVRGNTCLLGTFALCLFILLIALLAVGAWAFVKKDNVNTFTDELRNRTDTNLDKGVRMYDTEEQSKQFMDSVQKRFKCCGSHNGSADYKIVPQSCEKENYNKSCSSDYFLFVGNEIRAFLQKRFTIIAGLSIGVAVCVAFGFVFTLIMCCFVRKTTRILVS